MPTVFLNGRFVEHDDATVSVFDAGLQHGVGLFETMLGGVDPDASDDDRLERAWVLHLDEHLARLVGSARELALSESLRAPGLRAAVLETVARRGLVRARVRLTITGGDLNMLARGDARSEHTPTILIALQPATEYPAEMFERGVVAALADTRVNPLEPTQGHKTLAYWPRLRALQQAASRGAAEALFFQVTNHLAGGCVSNALVVRDGEIHTPIARGEEQDSRDAPGVALPSPVLPGIVRGWVRRWAGEHGVGFRARALTIDDVLSADEILLTNSGWGVLPITRVEREPIGDGSVGQMGRRLLSAWRSEVESASGW